MTIDIERTAAVAPSHDHGAVHHHGGHAHGPDHNHHPVHARNFRAQPAASVASAPPARRERGSLFLASAFDRLALALVLVGLLWIGVVWAVI